MYMYVQVQVKTRSSVGWGEEHIQGGGRPWIGHTRESRSEQGNAPQGNERYRVDYIIEPSIKNVPAYTAVGSI